MAKKKKAKARAPKKESKKQADEEELEEDFLGEDEEIEDDGADAGIDVAGEDDEDLPDEEDSEDDAEEPEEDAPPPKKEAAKEDKGETAQSLARKKEAARVKQGQPPVKKEWYEWKLAVTHDPKKGRKLVRYQQTKNGAQSEYVGWEKKMPKSFLNKLKAEGKIKS